jgi:hypothetical protein
VIPPVGSAVPIDQIAGDHDLDTNLLREMADEAVR